MMSEMICPCCGQYIDVTEVREEAIDKFAEDILNKINFEEKWLFICKSNNADTNIMISALKTCVKSKAEQLKEQK